MSLPSVAAAALLGGQPFDPSSIPNLDAWLDPDPAYLTIVAGGASNMADRTGLGHDATQTIVGREPDPIANDPLLNNQPSLTYGPGVQYFDHTLMAQAVSDWTFFFAVYNSVVAGIRAIYDDGTIRFRPSGGSMSLISGAGALSTPMGIGPHIVCGRLGTNGLLRVDATTVTGVLIAQPIGVNANLGARWTAGGDYFQTKIGDTYIYKRELTNGEVDTVMNGMGRKYNIPVV